MLYAGHHLLHETGGPEDLGHEPQLVGFKGSQLAARQQNLICLQCNNNNATVHTTGMQHVNEHNSIHNLQPNNLFTDFALWDITFWIHC